MLFNSYEFIFIFLPVTFIVFFWLGKSHGIGVTTFWMVVASVFFYGWWDYHYIPVLITSILFNYLVGRKIEKTEHKKRYLVFGITINLLFLGYFKYMNFILGIFNNMIGGQYFNLTPIMLPLGISFFTFTQTAYLIDLYRGESKNGSLLSYCEFVTVFPHLIAGPIINHKKMIPQFLDINNYYINYPNIAKGLTLFAMGLCKKTVIADTLAPWVDILFARSAHLSFLEAWLAAIGYTFQLYFDFSGYSEMAIGLGLMFNLQFPVNFDSPYQARSIIDFWRRWHMTLGQWVKEYLYIPLGGNRSGEFHKMRNLFISMLLVGLWHGAGWTFIFWGGLHGVFLMINHQWRRLNIHLPKAINWGMTFICVTICWVFFRATDFRQAFSILKAMVNLGKIVLPKDGFWDIYVSFLAGYGISFQPWKLSFSFNLALGIIAILFVILLTVNNPTKLIHDFHVSWKWRMVACGCLILSILHMAKVSPFLYFQF